MAKYFLRCIHISRGKGARATRAAAYRAGERIRDERTSEVYDYTDRHDVAYKEVVVPSDLAGRPDMSWTQDRSILWNAMEYSGLRCNSRLAREWLVLLPPELTAAERSVLARTFATELADKYRCAVDLTIHQPRHSADPRNHHAHLLMTTREVTPDGIGLRTTLELGGRERNQHGLGPSRDEYLVLRERWAQITNQALEHAGLAARVDHRSFERQGINREPTPTIPEKVLYAERKRGPSAAGDEIRARHRERIEARQKGPRELARVIEKQKQELKERAREDLQRREGQPRKPRWAMLTREQRNELRREYHKARRVQQRQDPEGEERRRAASRQTYYRSRERNPEAMRETRRQWRKAHADEVNRKQREYRRANAEELNRKRREARKLYVKDAPRKQPVPQHTTIKQPTTQPPQPKSPATTALDSARTWAAHRQQQGPGITAEESARNWAALREAQKTGPGADPNQHKPPTPPTRTQGPERTLGDADDPARKPNPTHDHDIEL